MLRILVAFWIVVVPISGFGSDPQLLKKASSWNWPDSQRLMLQVQSYLEGKLVGDELQQAKLIASNANSSSGVGLLDFILATTAKGEPAIASLKLLIDAPFTSESNSRAFMTTRFKDYKAVLKQLRYFINENVLENEVTLPVFFQRIVWIFE